MSLQRIIFRADGSAHIGLGHVIRSLALADMLQGHFELVFAIILPSEALKNQIEEYCNYCIILPKFEDINTELNYFVENHLSGREIVVLDGYKFDTRYQQGIKAKGCRLVCIDDINAYTFVADAVINHEGSIKASDYHGSFYTQYYLGFDYVLLRKPFLSAAAANYNNRSNADINTVFVSMGGGDIYNYTAKVVERLLKFDIFKDIHVVVGSAYPYNNELMATGKDNVHIYCNISASEMVSIMQKSHVAICSASSVCYEYMCIKGGLFLILTADNQQHIYQTLLAKNMALDFETACNNHNITQIVVENLRHTQQTAIDGKSGIRFLKLFQYLALMSNVSLRKATDTDKLLYFEYANDPLTRQSSFNSKPIEWETHCVWFEKKLRDTCCFMYVFMVAGEPAGQIRFDIQDNEGAVISYVLAANYRGQGLGHIILSEGILRLIKDIQYIPNNAIVGYVKFDNIASNKAFLKLGFSYTADTTTQSYRYYIDTTSIKA